MPELLKRHPRLLGGLAVLATALVMSGPAAAAPIAVGDGWHLFTWSGGNGAAIWEDPFTFTATVPAVVTVTDAFCAGDVFSITDFGLPRVNTTQVAADLDCSPVVDTPDAALEDRSYSHGRYIVLPGAHSIELTAVVSPFGSGAAFLRVDPLFRR